MMRLKFMLEYNCDPVWVLDGNVLMNAGLPDDLAEDSELLALIKEISADYDSHFINTPIEFTYKGFSSKEDETAFDKKLVKAIEMLKKAADGRYTVEIDKDLEDELKYLTDK